ncbi:MAG TPA: FliG C-terminal domain-containing protein, partial [Pirellulaceae bacterium]|nr:FliG C-terminal domain-containing protein [Pirellulaceae bacterium]
GQRGESFASDDAGVELMISSGHVHASSKPIESAPPFAFLHDAPAELVVKYLRHEHPQTIAVVLAHLPPQRAAAIVLQLPAATQTDVLLRIGEIAEMDSEIVREVERGLEAVLQHDLQASRKRGAGVATLQAILTAAGQSRDSLINGVADKDRQLAAQLGHIAPPALPSRLETYTSAPELLPTAAARTQIERRPQARVEALPNKPSLEFSELAQLDDRAWASLLRAIEPQLALLALAGATPELVARLLRQLPPRDARALERRMEQLGPLRLRDIEQAQQQVARIAAQLAAKGEIRLPRQRPFATAA